MQLGVLCRSWGEIRMMNSFLRCKPWSHLITVSHEQQIIVSYQLKEHTSSSPSYCLPVLSLMESWLLCCSGSSVGPLSAVSPCIVVDFSLVVLASRQCWEPMWPVGRYHDICICEGRENPSCCLWWRTGSTEQNVTFFFFNVNQHNKLHTHSARLLRFDTDKQNFWFFDYIFTATCFNNLSDLWLCY